MVIFHSYVSLPEGTSSQDVRRHRRHTAYNSVHREGWSLNHEPPEFDSLEGFKNMRHLEIMTLILRHCHTWDLLKGSELSENPANTASLDQTSSRSPHRPDLGIYPSDFSFWIWYTHLIPPMPDSHHQAAVEPSKCLIIVEVDWHTTHPISSFDSHRLCVCIYIIMYSIYNYV
jgi:hypothetical protein